MKAIKLAGVIIALSAVTAVATDGNVAFSVEYARNLNQPVPDGPNGVPRFYSASDSYIEFFLNVDVTGDNQGLAGFKNDIRIRKLANPGDAIGTNISGHPVLDWGAYYKNVKGYKSPATTIRGVVTDGGLNGGPGINVLPSLGYTTVGGFIDDVGAGTLTWDPVRLDGKVWKGVNQWGVGMASEKSKLLVDPAGNYMLNYGYWSMASFIAAQGGIENAKGVYKIEILPGETSVLSAEADLNWQGEVVSGVTTQLPGANVSGGAFIFEIDVPEPATLLLLAGAGAFIRRRRLA